MDILEKSVEGAVLQRPQRESSWFLKFSTARKQVWQEEEESGGRRAPEGSGGVRITQHLGGLRLLLQVMGESWKPLEGFEQKADRI